MTDIQSIKGDTQGFDVFVTKYNEVTGEDEIVNLTGAKAWFTAKRTSEDLDSAAIIKLDSVANPSQVVITGVTGKVRITLAPADTVNSPVKWLEYDVQIKEVDGTVTTVQKGKLELTKNITRSTT